MALFDNPAQDSGVFNFGIDETAKGYLLQTTRWTKFLSVVGFVLIAILILAGILMAIVFNLSGSRYSSFSGYGNIMIFIYALFAVLYFFPTYYLFKFSTQTKRALLNNNQHDFNNALSYLRNAFRFIGVLTLIILGCYALFFIIAIYANGADFMRAFG